MKNIIFFFKSLDKRYKAASIFVITILFTNALFEMLAIGILYPFVSMLVNSGEKLELDFDNEIFSLINQYLNMDFSINKILFFISLIFVIKFLLNVVTIYIQNKFSFSLLQNLSYKLFSSYVSRNYIDLSKENTSYLVRNLTYNLNTFVNGLNSFINIVAEILIVISITSLLLIINLKITMTIIIFFSIACAIFLFLTKLRVNKLANQRFKFEGQKVKSINEGLNGLIDIKLSGKISFFKNIYFIVENFLKKNYINFNFLIALPKVWIEFLTIGAFLFFSFFLINYSDAKFISFVPLIGIYALSAFKLMPSFNRILINYNTTKFTRKVFMNILLELKKIGKEKRRKSNKNIKTINNFKIQNLSFRYVKKKAIFNNLNLRFKKGKTYGIYGGSGKGKSTLINIILGMLKPNIGKIIFNDKQNILSSLDKWQEKISYIPQKPYFFDDNIIKNIAVGINYDEINLKKIDKCLEIVNLKRKIYSLKKKHRATIGEVGKKFSGGELQRIAIARAIYKDGEIFIFDEATSALDAKNENSILKKIKKLSSNKILIIVSHKKKLIDSCDYKIKI